MLAIPLFFIVIALFIQILIIMLSILVEHCLLINSFIAMLHLFVDEYFHLISLNFLTFFIADGIFECFIYFSYLFIKQD